ncbi:MAG TPA: adenylate/guanylate cyclase domain-containing protein [Steroidobacteraceae bacterium]|nr:adenylate/guanylate cyclase domain-containing protein [Steroidobacteraceae bacterium]
MTKTTRGTVLFADLRGYTALAERLAPARIVPLLDEFFGVLAAATLLHGGQVFHMAGDGMMAGFGLGAVSDGAAEAVGAGRAILQQFAEVAARWRADLSIETGVGIGLHLGEVALGTLGPPGYKRTTLVGDTVNVAARLCGRARAGELLLSCTVAAALAAARTANGHDSTPIAFLQLPQFELRGRTAPLDIWCFPAPERVTF